MTDQSSFCVVLCVLPQWVRSVSGPGYTRAATARLSKSKRRKKTGQTLGRDPRGRGFLGGVWLQPIRLGVAASTPSPDRHRGLSGAFVVGQILSVLPYKGNPPPPHSHTHTHTCINIHKHKSHTRKHLQGLISFLFPTAAGVLVGGGASRRFPGTRTRT